jgi:peptidoglycan/LPS O-acetylase OafA/YrhL
MHTEVNASLTQPSARNVQQRSMPLIAFFGLVLAVLFVEIKAGGLGRNIIRATGLCLGLLLVSCGGGGSGGSSGPQPATYTLTITGTAGSVSHTTSITLNVQ